VKAKGSRAGGTSLANIVERVVECAAAEEPATFADLVAAAGLDPGQDFVGASLAGLDLRGEDLRGFNFADANLRNADFRGANMYGVSIAGADTTGALGLPPPIPTRFEPQRVRDGSVIFEGVRLTHPDRILYPETNLTKLGVARYYAEMPHWVLPELSRRLLTLVRSPAAGMRTFYQKHIGDEAPEAIKRFNIDGQEEPEIYPYIEDLPGLIGLVQMGVLEIHPWGSRVDKLELPDRVTMDLDPDEGLPWERVTEAAIDLREALLGIGLKSFAKTTGGKGLHVIIPLTPKLGWDDVKTFAKWIVDSFVAQRPEDFTANMAKKARQGRIYIDYLRNSRGATAVGAYSPRARTGAPVSTPLSWEEVEQGVRPEGFTVETLPNRLAALGADPWAEIRKMRQTLSARVQRKVGI
jgi:bifunctional non-homologous end joining protein LigD